MVEDSGVRETQLKRSFFAVLAGFLVFFVLAAFVWALRGLLSPVLVGFLLAYIANPVVNWVQVHWRWPRLLTAVLLLVILAAAVAGAGVWLGPLAWEQASQFLENLPDYVDRVFAVLHRGEAVREEIRQRVTEAVQNPAKFLPMVLSGAARGVGIFASAMGNLTYWGIYITLLVVFFATFASRMPDIKSWSRQFLPLSHRDEILRTVQKISDAAGIFLRTRLIIAAILAVLLSAGWAFAGVPYWFVLGTATAILNIIPYAALFGWLLALVITALGVDSVGGLLYALLWPTVVYAVVQFLDGWVLSPWLEGDQLKVHPVVVLFAILAGGAFAGVLGMLMAIPLAAAWQICFSDVIKPRVVDWANSH